MSKKERTARRLLAHNVVHTMTHCAVIVSLFYFSRFLRQIQATFRPNKFFLQGYGMLQKQPKAKSSRLDRTGQSTSAQDMRCAIKHGSINVTSHNIFYCDPKQLSCEKSSSNILIQFLLNNMDVALQYGDQLMKSLFMSPHFEIATTFTNRRLQRQWRSCI